MLAPHRRDLFLLPPALPVAVSAMPTAQARSLGTIQFPTSASSPDAQARFERGIAALHSFWYPVALEEFRAARRLEPGFAVAIWGEAMAHNHPVWGDPQETDAARQVLAQLPDGPVPGITTRACPGRWGKAVRTKPSRPWPGRRPPSAAAWPPP